LRHAKRTAQPAIDSAGQLCGATFKNTLSHGMRSHTTAGRGGGQQQQFSLCVKFVKRGERWMQAKEAVKINYAARFPRPGKRQRPTSAPIVSIAIWGDGGQAVEPAAENDQNKALISQTRREDCAGGSWKKGDCRDQCQSGTASYLMH
jgi:hypothetical protein